MFPQIGKTVNQETICKMGVSEKGGCLTFITVLSSRNSCNRWDNFRHNEILDIILRTGSERAMPQFKIVEGFHPINLPKLVCCCPGPLSLPE